jgi:hypothetical protein
MSRLEEDAATIRDDGSPASRASRASCPAQGGASPAIIRTAIGRRFKAAGAEYVTPLAN